MTNPFLQMLQHLRREEEVTLYGLLLDIPEADRREAIAFLAAEYAAESLDYPGAPPPFDAPAAAWAATTVYLAAQLLLHRQHEVDDLPRLLPPYVGARNAAAVLSADLTLRFAPDILAQLKKLDPEDELIPILENHLLDWHYSGVAYPLPVEHLDFTPVVTDDCLRRLYIDCVIACRKTSLARHPALRDGVGAALGMYANLFWNEFREDYAKTT